MMMLVGEMLGLLTAMLGIAALALAGMGFILIAGRVGQGKIGPTDFPRKA
jgi:hypothetical protein